ncbi:MAG: crotonase [Rhodospirillaceae bacterium]|nr:crotonase [Rhodospirillaceae bacterium]|tara:strand:+ start:2317 stop:3105 length:789 start_codon:yes stop_codon:yes gene_type:complete
MKLTTINLNISDGIATILLNRPNVLNAINHSMWEELIYVFHSLGNSSEARVAIITGAGRGFCSGADLKEVAWRGETLSESRSRIERNNQQLAREMVATRIPIIAAINGYALGGGVEIALAADLRIASENAKFGFPEATIGRFISGGASLLLPKTIGMSWAKRLIFTGEHITANKASEIGLVEEITSSNALTERANELAKMITQNAPISIELSKKVLNKVSLDQLETALAFETEALIATYTTLDNEEGVAAFSRREAPNFSGE